MMTLYSADSGVCYCELDLCICIAGLFQHKTERLQQCLCELKLWSYRDFQVVERVDTEVYIEILLFYCKQFVQLFSTQSWRLLM